MFIVGPEKRETSERLAKRMKCKCDKEYEGDGKEFIINYGGKCKIANLNTKIRFNKLRAFRILKKAEVPVPDIFNKYARIPEECYPVLTRRKYHARGEDIIFINNKEEMNEMDREEIDFIVKYIQNKAEYRVHVLGDIIASISKKKKRNEDADIHVRSFENGWTHREYHGMHYFKLAELGKKAKNALGYDFGSVDIILGNDNKFYVLEVNSGSKLNKKRRIIYAKYFKQKEQEWLKERGE